MAISEMQLATWTNPGALSSSEETYASIQAALAPIEWPPGHKARLYLQGSYRNHTNIRGDSDVDVVVFVPNYLVADTTKLRPTEKAAYEAWKEEAPGAWELSRDLVLARLKKVYSGEVKPGRIALSVKTPRLIADVVVAIEHRDYSVFLSAPGAYEADVVTFKPQDGSRWIVNYPKRHFVNASAKNAKARTSERFKPTVRLLKNAFRALVDKHRLAEAAAFSYAIECYVYNVPDHLFVEKLTDRFANMVNWYDGEEGTPRLSRIRRVSEVELLIGNGPEQWPLENAVAFREGLKIIWHEWGT